jgi:tetratricopeptide (TPR) repeat protein
MGDYAEALGIFEELKEDFPLDNSHQDYKKEYREILNNLGNCYFRLE